MIIAPAPALEVRELPLIFEAINLTCTESPKLSEYGLAVRADKGTVHCKFARIVLSLPLQLVKSSVYC